MTVRCVECGTPMGDWEKRDVPYECGLPGVHLRDAAVATCPQCGAWEAKIPNVEELHRILAARVARRSAELIPAEIRFLRKHLGWSGRDFAKMVGYRPETVSRWENGHAELPVAIDRLLRAYAILGPPVADYRDHDGEEPEEGIALVFKSKDDSWSVSAA